MENRTKFIAGLSVAFLVGAAGGLALGGYGGFRLAAGSILDGCVSRDAREIQTRVATLKDLRAGRHEQAIELIESDLDDALIILDPAEPYPSVTERTVTQVRKAIGGAKAYRTEHPRRSTRPAVDKMITNLFAGEEYR